MKRFTCNGFAAGLVLWVATVSLGAEPLKICATLPDLGGVAQTIGGPEVEVTIFAKGAEDPHFVEARPSFVKTLSGADLFIENGLELEIGWAPVLLKNARNGKVMPGAAGYLDASAAIRPIEVPTGNVDRSLGDVHAAGNPHYMLDPMNGLRVAALVRDKLSELRPDKKAGFESRYQALRLKISEAMVGKELAGEYEIEKLALLFQHGKLAEFLRQTHQAEKLGGWLAAMQPYHGARIIDEHANWSYLLLAFGLSSAEHMEPKPGVSPTTRHLAEVIELMQKQHIRVIVTSPYYDRRHARFVADKTGARIAELSHQSGGRSGTDDYVSMLDYNVKQLAAALGSEREMNPGNTPIGTAENEGVVLRAAALSLSYGRRRVISGANFTVRRGERWMIVGPNGEGKTTLLRGILGLLPAPESQLWRNPALMARRRLGFVPQRCEFSESLPTTVREFVVLGLVGQRVGRAEERRRLEWALGRVNLLDRIDADYGSLSGGQRQRALVARALVRQPAVLLLDEPGGGLDLTSQDALIRALWELNHRDGLTMMLVTHDVELAARFATHVALVHGGNVYAGRVDDVLKPGLLERVYKLPIVVLSHSEGVVSLRIGREIGERGA